MSLSSDFLTVFTNINEDITSLETQVQGKADASSIPLSTSQLTNDSGFVDATALSSKQDVITAEDKLSYDMISGAPSIPTKTSDLENDSEFITSAYVEEAVSGKADASALEDYQLKLTVENKLDYSLVSGAPSIPLSTSELTNDSDFCTSAYVSAAVSGKQDKLVPEKPEYFRLVPYVDTSAEGEAGIPTAYFNKGANATYTPNLQYSLTNGATWTDLTFSGKYSDKIEVTNPFGILFRGHNPNGLTQSSGTTGYSVYLSLLGTNILWKAMGNVMTLLDETGRQNVVPAYGLKYLFYGCKKLTDARELMLPANILFTEAYLSMFNGCTALVLPPRELPAKFIGKNCYKQMFFGCTSLVETPIMRNPDGDSAELNGGMDKIAVVGDVPYTGTFGSCTAISKAYWEVMPKTKLLSSDYTSWGTALISAPSGVAYLPYGVGKGVVVQTSKQNGWQFRYYDVPEAVVLGSQIPVTRNLTATGDPLAFTADFKGNAIQKFAYTQALSGTIEIGYSNLSATTGTNYPTVELMIPITGNVTAVNFPEGTQAIDIPEELEAAPSGVTYLDFTLRGQMDASDNTYVVANYSYSFTEAIPEPEGE